MRLYLEKLLEGSKYEKILVSKPLRKIKGRGVPYRMPWKKMLSKANGTYSYIGEEASTQYLYHVTKTSNVPKIKKQGLLMMQTSNWVKGDFTRYGKGEVFAFEHPEDAIRWAARMDWDFNQTVGSGKISILKIKRVGKWTEDKNDPISHAGSKGKRLKTIAKVAPEDILKAFPVTIDLTKKLTADEDVSGIFEEEKKEKRGAIIPYIIIDGECYIALMKPSDPKYGGPDFQIAKGVQEGDENITQTAIREGEQELGLKITNEPKLLWNNEKTGMNYFMVEMDKKVALHPQVNEDGIMETGEAKWFHISEAEKIIRDWQRPVINIFKRALGVK
jgi:predicted NUDIX family NTP pyrophosphohydrolase